MQDFVYSIQITHNNTDNNTLFIKFQWRTTGGKFSEHARAKCVTQLRGIHATRAYKKQQLCKYCEMFGTK
jgi:hypothetical protein